MTDTTPHVCDACGCVYSFNAADATPCPQCEPLRALLAERDALRVALRGFLDWANRKCPCHNDLPDPCPLCGASVENLEGCRAADETLPRALLAQARAALNTSTGDDA